MNKGNNLNLLAKEELSSRNISSTSSNFKSMATTIVLKNNREGASTGIEAKVELTNTKRDHLFEEDDNEDDDDHNNKNTSNNSITNWSCTSSRNSFMDEEKANRKSSSSSRSLSSLDSTPKTPKTFINMIQRKFSENCSLILEKVPRDPMKVVR
jgi:hypothetical protein